MENPSAETHELLYEFRLQYFREEITRLAPMLGAKVMTSYGPCVLLGIKPKDDEGADCEHIPGKKFPSYCAVVGFERNGEMEVEDNWKTKWVEAIE